MPANATQQEPSMDEILASIKKIITEDERQSQMRGQPPAKGGTDRDVSAGGPGALSAGNVQGNREVRRAMPMGPRANPFLPQRQATTEPPRDQRVPSPAWRSGAVAPRQEPAAPTAQRLASDVAERTATAAFGKLSQTLMTGQSRTLEDTIGEMIRPLLKIWLDENLPSLVERLVREEIEKVARGGR